MMINRLEGSQGTKDWKNEDLSIVIGTFISQLFLPRLRDHCRNQSRKTVRDRVMTVFSRHDKVARQRNL